MLYTETHRPERAYEIGSVLTVCAVTAANVIKDWRENVRNLTGGEMTHYEKLIEKAVDRALEKLADKARVQDYDGVIGVTLTHPTVVEGAVEVVAYGNGFRYRPDHPST